MASTSSSTWSSHSSSGSGGSKSMGSALAYSQLRNRSLRRLPCPGLAPAGPPERPLRFDGVIAPAPAQTGPGDGAGLGVEPAARPLALGPRMDQIMPQWRGFSQLGVSLREETRPAGGTLWGPPIGRRFLEVCYPSIAIWARTAQGGNTGGPTGNCETKVGS